MSKWRKNHVGERTIVGHGIRKSTALEYQIIKELGDTDLLPVTA